MSSLIVSLEGLELLTEEKELLAHPSVSGVILFSKNYESLDQLRALVKSLREIKRPDRLLITVDQEGGRVQRFRKGFTEIPPMRTLGEQYDSDPSQAMAAAKHWAGIMVSELLAIDVDLSFAPVLDLDKGLSTVIGNRAFHHDPKKVIDLAKAWIAGMREAGMKAVGKHFPGHGHVVADSHVSIPVDTRSFEEIELEDLKPFAELIHELDAIMPAHVIYEKCDAAPAGFSEFWLQEVLRKRLQFQGKIFSDDLTMEGASVAGDMIGRAKAAIHAGCDYLLICHDREGAVNVLERLQHFAHSVTND